METLLRLHAAYSDAAVEEGDSADGDFHEAAASQLPLLLTAYGAATPQGLTLERVIDRATSLMRAVAGQFITLPPTHLLSVGP